MKKEIVISLLIMGSLSTFLMCTGNKNIDNRSVSALFNKYWYAGKAEITSYALNQARYGESHKGEAGAKVITTTVIKKKSLKLDYWTKSTTS